MFKRVLDEKSINTLIETELFQQKLKPDILSGKVFPAIRPGYINFYYKGGCLFKFKDGKFTTHKKYAAVIKFDEDKDYVSEDDLLNKVKLIANFSDNYDYIKKICELYAGKEAEGVSSLYRKYPFTKKELDIVVLDIEIAFSKNDEKEDEKSNRIDLLLFNKKTQTLRFYEAKDFSNAELWSSLGKSPKVVNQIEAYQKRIQAEQADKNNIIEQYKEYINIMNQLFGCDIPHPERIDDKVTLLVFGFDTDQLNGKIKKLLVGDDSLKGIQYYMKGGVDSLEIKNMWDKIKCR